LNHLSSFENIEEFKHLKRQKILSVRVNVISKCRRCHILCCGCHLICRARKRSCRLGASDKELQGGVD